MKRMNPIKLLGISSLGMIFVQNASACSTCFLNAPVNSPITEGSNFFVMALFGTTAFVFICFSSFFIHLYRRARLVEREDQAADVIHHSPHWHLGHAHATSGISGSPGHSPASGDRYRSPSNPSGGFHG